MITRQHINSVITVTSRASVEFLYLFVDNSTAGGGTVRTFRADGVEIEGARTSVAFGSGLFTDGENNLFAVNRGGDLLQYNNETREFDTLADQVPNVTDNLFRFSRSGSRLRHFTIFDVSTGGLVLATEKRSANGADEGDDATTLNGVPTNQTYTASFPSVLGPNGTFDVAFGLNRFTFAVRGTVTTDSNSVITNYQVDPTQVDVSGGKARLSVNTALLTHITGGNPGVSHRDGALVNPIVVSAYAEEPGEIRVYDYNDTINPISRISVGSGFDNIVGGVYERLFQGSTGAFEVRGMVQDIDIVQQRTQITLNAEGQKVSFVREGVKRVTLYTQQFSQYPLRENPTEILFGEESYELDSVKTDIRGGATLVLSTPLPEITVPVPTPTENRFNQ